MLATDLKITAADAALTISMSTIGLAIAVLPWSLVADRLGRVQTMRISLIAATTFGLLMPLSPSFEFVLALRTLEGVALGGLPAVAIAFLNEEVHRRHAAIAAGTYISGTAIGGLLGRLAAGPVAEQLGWRFGLLAASILAATAAVIFLIMVPKPQGFTARRRAPGPSSDPPLGRILLSHLSHPGLLMLFGQGFLLMGGFVATYNYLTFRLEAPPFELPPTITSLLFLVYLAGSVSSRLAGQLASVWNRKPVLLGSILIMIIGIALTLSDWLPLLLTGLVVLTAGFFGAHSIASGWVGRRAVVGRAQAASLYNFFYYAGSSLFGWMGGVAFVQAGWPGIVFMIIGLAIIAVLWAAGSSDLTPKRRRGAPAVPAIVSERPADVPAPAAAGVRNQSRSH